MTNFNQTSNAPSLLPQLGSVHVRTVANRANGTFCTQELRSKVRVCNDYALSSLYPISRLVCLENTHNLCHGAVLDATFVGQVSQIVREHRMQLHVDGARIFNAAVALDVPVSELSRPVDSLSVCLSKGLCCPMGTLVVGDQPFIHRAARLRKALGGGLRQAGFMAATGLYALKHMVQRLRDDHERAYLIAHTICRFKSKYVSVDVKLVQTNIVYLNLEHLTAADFCERLMQVTPDEAEELGPELCKVRMLAFAERRVRFLTSHAVDDSAIELVLKKLIYILNQLEKRGLNGLRN